MKSTGPDRRAALKTLAGTAAVLATSSWRDAYAQAGAYPSKAIRIVVPFAAGGPTDLMARVVGKALSQSMKQPVIVDNKPGGGGVIGLSDVMQQPSDGYTLVFPSILAVTNPALMPNYPFDTLRDFSPVTVVGFIPHALVVRSDFAAKTVADLVSLGKAGSLAYGSSGNGTSAHLAGAMFADRAGLRMVHVPYRGAGPALQDLLGGQIQCMFLDMTLALSQIQAGKLRALAVAPARRVPLLPEIPTIAESGYPGFDIHAWYGLMVRSGTPGPLIDRLALEVNRALETPEVRETFTQQGIVAGGMPPTEFTALVRSDLAMWKRTIADLRITLQ